MARRAAIHSRRSPPSLVALALLVVALALLVALGAPPLRGQEGRAPEALGGFDPVLLVEGRDELGSEELSIVHQGLWYLFASEETRDRFAADPRRYGVAMGGSCARMGPGAAGRPDLFTVHRGRIYLFGTAECQRAFEEAPERYLPPAPEPWAPTDEERRRGEELLDRAVEALGGRERLAAVDGLRERGEVVLGGGAEARVHPYVLSVRFPDRWREERTFSWGTLTTVLAPEGAFHATPRGSEPLRPVHRADTAARLARRDALAILRLRGGPGYEAAWIGGEMEGDREVARVAVRMGEERTELAVDGATGRVLRLAFVGRDPVSGAVGRVVRTFDDFREVDGIPLPFRRRDAFAGREEVFRDVRVEAIELGPALPAGTFRAERPGASR